MGWPRGELSLTLVNDRAMARLNRATFDRRGPTNVISFPLDATPAIDAPDMVAEKRGSAALDPLRAGPPPVLGEVVISLETTRRQAQEYGWPWEELLDFFLIHGILHLLGYDHINPASEVKMNAQTWELMSMLYPGRQWDQKF